MKQTDGEMKQNVLLIELVAEIWQSNKQTCLKWLSNVHGPTLYATSFLGNTIPVHLGAARHGPESEESPEIPAARM